MQNLGPEELTDIAERLPPKELLKFCGSSSGIYTTICKDEAFLRKLAKKYLTTNVNNVNINNVLRDVIYITTAYNAFIERKDDDISISNVFKHIASNGYEVAMNQFIEYIIKINRERLEINGENDTGIEGKYEFFVGDPLFHFDNLSCYLYYYAGLNGQLKFIQYMDETWYFDVSVGGIFTIFVNGGYAPGYYFALIGAIKSTSINKSITSTIYEHVIDYMLNRLNTFRRNDHIDYPNMKDLVVRIVIRENCIYTRKIFSNKFITGDDIFISTMDNAPVLATYYAASLNYWNEIIDIMRINWDYEFGDNDLLFYIADIRYNITSSSIDIAKYLVDLTRNIRKDNKSLEIYEFPWKRKPLDYDPSIHNIDNPNISKTISYLINERVANPQWILINF